MLDAFGAAADFVSLHTDDPSTTGTNEVTGGSYTRESPAWGTASAGAITNASAIVFDVPSSTTIKFLGYWSASTAGTFYGSRALDQNQTFATAGTYTIAIGNLSESIS
jgi:hypothetical protein